MIGSLAASSGVWEVPKQTTRWSYPREKAGSREGVLPEAHGEGENGRTKSILSESRRVVCGVCNPRERDRVDPCFYLL